MRPLGNRVIVKPREVDTVSPGGIYLPLAGDKERPSEGTVTAVGPGYRSDDGSFQPLDVETGDRVLFSKYGGNEIEINGEKLVVLNEDDLLVIL